MESTGGGSSGGEDVLMQILVCLPVASLLRFKSVCKSWRALIESSFFINLHTTATTSSSSNKFGTFIIQAIEYFDELRSCRSKMKMFMLSSGSGGMKMFMLSSGSGGEDEDDVDDDHVVFSPFYKEDSLLTGSIKMVGSCNGLICLHDSHLRDVSLWNPATRQFRILPKSITIQVQGVSKEDGLWDEEDGLWDDFMAFGFDVKTKDYKVVCITPFRSLRDDGHKDEGCMCRVQVYSLSTDSWRLLEGIDYLPVVPYHHLSSFLNQGIYFFFLDYQGIYLNGSYFFLGRKNNNAEWSGRSKSIPRSLGNNFLMLSFDFTKEIFTIMQLPDHDVGHRMVLSNLGEKIVVSITRGDHDYDYEFCEIWVLNDHDNGVNKESWTKLHSYHIKNNRASHSNRTVPICISDNGKFALWTINNGSYKLQLFNLVTKEAKKDLTIGNGVLRADVYKQSLVSIIGGNGAAASR